MGRIYYQMLRYVSYDQMSPRRIDVVDDGGVEEGTEAGLRGYDGRGAGVGGGCLGCFYLL